MVTAVNFFGILQYTTNLQRHHLVGTPCRRVIPIPSRRDVLQTRDPHTHNKN